MKKNFKLFIQIIHEIIYILNKKQKKELIYVYFVIIVRSFFELLGVTAILPFVQAVLSPDVLMENGQIRWLCELVNIQISARSLLMITGVAIIVLYIAKNVYLVYSSYVISDYSTRLKMELSVDMLRSYMDRPYTFFIDTNSSIIKSGCNGSVGAFYTVIESIISLFTESLTMILIGAYLLYTDMITAIAIICLMSVVLLCTVFGFKPIIKRAGYNSQQATFAKTRSVAHAIDGIKDILVMRRKKLFIEAFEEAANEERKTSIIYNVLTACPDRITEGICISGIIGIVCCRMLLDEGDMSAFIPKLALFAMAAFKILPSVGKIANRVSAIVYNRPMQSMVFNNVYEVNQYKASQAEYLQKAGDEVDEYEVLESNSRETANQIANKEYDIEYRDVTWKYRNQKAPVLKEFNLTIHKSESVGFIGPSGSGKTTAADVLLGLLQPQYGHIYVDGKDIYAIPETWSHMIGYVPQSVFLIDDTIRANVAFGIQNANDDDVWEALDRAQLKIFVESLPNLLDTHVGERGVKLSGGQRQRIAIARALYSKPQVLVMDEATAALDNETENAVMESIEALQGSITLIIVAHRLTTIRKCDKVYVIKNGIAVERNKSDIGI